MFICRAIKLAGGDYGFEDGSPKVPFAEALNVRFNYDKEWKSDYIGDYDDNGNQRVFEFYFEEGVEYTVYFECSLGDLTEYIMRAEKSLAVLNDCYLRIIQRTGAQPDPNQDYKFFTGLTLTNLIPVEISMFGEDEPKRPFSFFWQVGYAFGCGRNTSFEPSLVFKMDADSRKQIDVNVRFIQHREDQDLSWWAGVGYKHNLDDGGGQSLVLLPNATVRIGKFRVGYAFNLDLNKLVSHNYGTHELMLGYSFCHTSKFCR
jgi:hypothetical protein